MNQDPIVMKYVGDGSVRSFEQMLKEIEMLITYYHKRPGLGVWAVELKNSAEFVGAAGLTYNENHDSVELGYRLLANHWNRGYATEAANRILQYAFQKLNLSNVIASAHVENIRSQTVLEKVGMRQFGTGFEFNCIQVYYKISREDYASTIANPQFSKKE